MTTAVKFEWQWDFKFLLLVCAVLPLTVSAMFWQLDRAEQKSEMLRQLDEGLASPPVLLEQVAEDAQNYTQVIVEGRWSESVFLLDNRTRNGRVGYEVVGLFEREESVPVLVNRGWVPAGNDRSVLPEIDIPPGNHRVEGYLYRSVQKPIVFAEQQWSGSWPERAQIIDLELMSERLQKELYPFVVRISPESPLAYQADWRIEREGPGMHIGYAVQWALISLTIVIMSLFVNSNLRTWWKHRKQN
ncbi:MAG: SURF1 family protein [Porticoccaceae bacterium]